MVDQAGVRMIKVIKISPELSGVIPKKSKSPNKSQKNKVWDDQNGLCFRCRRHLSPSITEYHHIKHRSKGGSSKTKNLRALCSNCHKKIHNEERVKVQER